MAEHSFAAAFMADDRIRVRPLTELQLVQMDDVHYMSESQKNFFRARLVALEEWLKARTRTTSAEIATCSAGADPADRASAEEEHQLAIGARVRDAEKLLDVAAAIKRIDQDSFGWCLDTGEMIGVGRLLICPTTVLCVEAQQRRESKNSHYGA
ncbi:TraR/DksA family transcriptional regulator [Janthinobacterium sp. Ant5-2-1]|uniref:TraR/DksA family transcriptional regulator n=1 Tax=Janthinobacterium sp. Ant5-2-1 TaxID=1755239 RepID=UPI000717F98C|nr:TraR/DksA C4-type zinc finger protein [Janthinobacterium sp. Ant5-2-1]